MVCGRIAFKQTNNNNDKKTQHYSLSKGEFHPTVFKRIPSGKKKKKKVKNSLGQGPVEQT